MNKFEEKRERCRRINILLHCISENGTYNFRQLKDGQYSVARIELEDSGKIFFVDDWTQKRIYLNHARDRFWQDFSHGGTMKRLIVAFSDWISGKTKFVSAGHFVYPNSPEYPHPWAYGDGINEVIETALVLGILEPKAIAPTKEGVQNE